MTHMDYIISDDPISKTFINTDYPFVANYVDILASKIHYVDEGDGETLVFLHGIPAWSYSWRNIIPELALKNRCIAPDLIGFGRSGKPDIEYTVFDHIDYIEKFIETLKLKNITLVMHAWGSVIGFEYARRHPENVKALAFFEAHLRPVTDWNMLSLPVQELAANTHTADKNFDAIMNQQYYLNTVLPSTILRPLTSQELSYYHEPFTQPNSAKPIWQYNQEFPLGKQSAINDLIANYSEWLQQSAIPKLMLYAIPGYLTTIDIIQWCKNTFPKLKLVDAGDALHYPQEENPTILCEELRIWLDENVVKYS